MIGPIGARALERLRPAAILVAAVVTGCPAPGGSTMVGSAGPRCTVACVDRAYAARGGGVQASDPVEVSGAVDVSLLVRSFLPPEDSEPSGYVFHNYLFFADSGDETRPIRLAAAAAVLKLFSRVEAAAMVGVDTTRLAALHVPVCSSDVAAWVLADPGGGQRPWIPECARDARTPPATRAERLLAGYDLQRMRLIKRRVEEATGRSLPRVALLAYPTPLGAGGAIDAAQLYIIDLEGRTPDEVGQIMTRFQDGLESPRGLHGQFPDAAEQNRDVYARLGTVLSEYTGGQ